VTLAMGATTVTEESGPLQVPASAPIPDEAVKWSIMFIDQSGLLEQVAIRKEEDSRGAGGRPETFPVRALFVAMVLR
jgi:hypothetical protein